MVAGSPACSYNSVRGSKRGSTSGPGVALPWPLPWPERTKPTHARRGVAPRAGFARYGQTNGDVADPMHPRVAPCARSLGRYFSERTVPSFVKRCVFCYSMPASAKFENRDARFSVLGACGTHEAVGGVRRWRRSWVNIHPLPAAIQVLGRRKHRSAAPTGPSVARFAVQRVPGYGSGQPCRSATFMR